MNRILGKTRAEGPGLRTALWVQGCTIRCPGCFNPHLWSNRGGTPRDPGDLARELINLAEINGVEGITLLGGEPFDQALPLAAVAQRVRATGLSIMTFTGYELETLREWSATRSDIKALLASTDLLVDGPYRAGSPDHARPWAGSANQSFHALSQRYETLLDGLEGIPDRLEVHVRADGSIAVNGWADDETLDLLLEDLGRRQR
ncbi:4Fe-4S single cluster domain-containing protein [Pseudonocardia alaniniphila]|uniref:Radical SAM protein n=1 Tax=Pseudonocardia alaniniphila TaxID=75291 RepID=A0ABS9T9G6_9PSEU|nr:4Fe-4S single cluster domain-containing protein [Pseudonocardia alaniniphila]MCH6165180.1 radical SAM protein [Pseudonocardia alaniniphila]